MRFVIGVVLALSVGIGAYLGSAQVADSAKTPPPKVTLRTGDLVTLGQIQCQAIALSRAHPARTRDANLRCSTGPRSRATVSVNFPPGGIYLVKKVGQGVCTLRAPGQAPGHHVMFSASLECWNGRARRRARKHVDASVEFLPSRLAVLKNGKTVYRTGWDPG